MKKLITLMTALTLMTTIVACGGNNTKQQPAGTDNTQQSEPEIGNSSITSDSGDTEGMMDCEYLYGKVSKITGNEIELALAKIPEIDDTDGEEGDEESSEDTGSLPNGAIMLTPAITIDPNDVGDANIEYTGETLTLTIPTGVKFDSMGQESSMSALKKGSIISVTVDNLDDMNISAVSILS